MFSFILKLLLGLPVLLLCVHMVLIRSDEVVSYITSEDLFTFHSVPAGLLMAAFLSFVTKNQPLAIFVLATVVYQLKAGVDYGLLPDMTTSSLQKNYDLSGRVAIVTGANSGIGLSVSGSLVSLGCEVIMACRREESCQKASAAVNEKASNGGRAVPMQLDLSDLKSVDAFTENFLSKFNRLDILVNNAGFASVSAGATKLTEQGLEIGFGSMHIGHFYLTKLLLPTLQDTLSKNPDVRVVTVSSAAAHMPTIVTGDVFLPSLYEGDGEGDLRGEITSSSSLNMYVRAKAANVLFTRQLQKRVPEMTTCSMHVGAVATSIWSNEGTPEIVRLLVDGYTSFTMRSLEEGSRTVLYCALSKDDSIMKAGTYLDGMGKPLKDKEMSKFCSDEKLELRLWEVSERLVEDYIATKQ